METTTDKLLKNVANLFIAAGWLWVFQELQWITFTNDMPFYQTLALTSLVAWLTELIIDWIYVTFIFVTCGMGCFTLPLFYLLQGWLYLWGTAQITHWFTINGDFFWTGLLMSIAFGWVRIQSATKSNATTTNDSDS